MVDCGATASAGPEASIQQLRSVLKKVDPQSTVHFDPDLILGMALASGARLWVVSLFTSTLSGTSKTFSAFVLPNPQEIYEPWFCAETMLVPILVGMDFLGPKGVGMVIDFNDGHCWASQLDGSSPMDLPQNHKGHFKLDIVHILTGTFSDGQPPKGTCQVNRKVFNSVLTLTFWVLELFTMTSKSLTVDSSNNDSNVHARCQFLKECHDRHVSLLSSQQSMSDQRGDPLLSPTSSTRQSHVFQEGDLRGQGSRVGLDSRVAGGSSSRMLAMFQESQRLRERIQQVWRIEPVLRGQPQDAHPMDGQPREVHGASGPFSCQESPEQAPDRSQRHEAESYPGGDGRGLCGHPGEVKGILPARRLQRLQDLLRISPVQPGSAACSDERLALESRVQPAQPPESSEMSMNPRGSAKSW